jgi:TRAP transporter TAXI family solute receptor
LVESTGGSVYNINTIRAGELSMGVAQSDNQYNAYNGIEKEIFIKAGPFRDLRSVFSVHAEPVTIVARADSGIKNAEDLVGKRVNIGNPGSGTEATWNVMWSAMGHTNADLKLVSQWKITELAAALCGGKIDAFFWLVGHPSSLIKETTSNCDAVIAEVSGPAIERLVADNTFYRTATIPGDMYLGSPEDVATFGVGATLVSSTATSEDIVYQVVKAVFDNLDDFKKLHPAFANLKESEMISGGLSAPLHDGALKYYKERGFNLQ